jgi:hypothetical protein
MLRRPAATPALLAALLACSSGDKGAPPAPAPAGEAAAPAAAPGAVDPAVEQFRPEDPDEVARRAEREEARAAFRILREAFVRGGRASRDAARRLEAAVAAVPPPGGARWQVTCRDRACRISAAAPGSAWQAALVAAPAVTAVADRLAADPDRRDTSVYLLLAHDDAAPGDALVAELERELVASAEARACATTAQASGTIRYELRVDASGFTYRADGDVPWPVVDCVNGVLDDLMRGIEVPSTAKSATRTVALRL